MQDKLIFQMTGGEFLQLLKQANGNGLDKPQQKNIVKGIPAAAAELNVSITTIHNWKKGGALEGTYSQIGRHIEFDLDKLREKFSK